MRFLGIGKSRAEKELAKILKGQEIPAFPGVAVRVLEKLRNPDVDFAEVSEDLKWDPALTMQILKLVNSAAYGTAHPIQDVTHAVSFMGRAALEQVVLGVAVRNAIPDPEAHGFDTRRFWTVASYRGALAKAIARELHPATEGECFTSALLQDLAIPVLANALKRRYTGVLSRWHSDSERSLASLESEVFGWSHDEVGGLICSMWELPPGLGNKVAVHHSDQVSDQSLTPAMRLTSEIREVETPENIDAMLEIARSEYGLSPDALLETMELAREQASELARVFCR